MRLVALTALAMLAFAGNSLLCRLALGHTSIDPISFTTLRLISGALALGLLLRLRSPNTPPAGDWPSALTLFFYAAPFSAAYVALSTGSGALLLFGSVQATMIGWAWCKGERFQQHQMWGLLTAFIGLIGLLWPGLEAPPIWPSAMMIGSGIAWGVYSLLGRRQKFPLATTTGNFWRASLLASGLSLLLLPLSGSRFDGAGLACAVASGALTSGLGYAVWYAVVPRIPRKVAGSVQLVVPVLAAGAGLLVLQEPLSVRLVVTSLLVIGGVFLAITAKAV